MTIALPAWRKTCVAQSLRVWLIPCDVKTRWNSTYDMLQMALQYHSAIDHITTDKTLKLRKYELDDDDWEIITDLIRVLKVCIVSYLCGICSWRVGRFTRTEHCFSLKIPPPPSHMSFQQWTVLMLHSAAQGLQPSMTLSNMHLSLHVNWWTIITQKQICPMFITSWWVCHLISVAAAKASSWLVALV